MRIRLDRWLSGIGVCSRSEGKSLVRSGAVRVNGVRAREPEMTVETETDRLEIRETGKTLKPSDFENRFVFIDGGVG